MGHLAQVRDTNRKIARVRKAHAIGGGSGKKKWQIHCREKGMDITREEKRTRQIENHFSVKYGDPRESGSRSEALGKQLTKE